MNKNNQPIIIDEAGTYTGMTNKNLRNLSERLYEQRFKDWKSYRCNDKVIGALYKLKKVLGIKDD